MGKTTSFSVSNTISHDWCSFLLAMSPEKLNAGSLKRVFYFTLDLSRSFTTQRSRLVLERYVRKTLTEVRSMSATHLIELNYLL